MRLTDEVARLRAELEQERAEKVELLAHARELAALLASVVPLADADGEPLAAAAQPGAGPVQPEQLPARRQVSASARRMQRLRAKRRAAQAVTGGVTPPVTVTPGDASHPVTVTPPGDAGAVTPSPSPAPPPKEKTSTTSTTSARARVGVSPSQPAAGDAAQASGDASLPAHMALFAWMLETRSQVYPQAWPLNPPADFADWYSRALAEAGGSEEPIRAAWQVYLVSPWALARNPVAPVVGFTSGRQDWRSYIPGQAEGARVVRPAALERRAQRGTDSLPPRAPTPAPQLPDTDAGRMWGRLLEGLREQGVRYGAEQLGEVEGVELEAGVLVARFRGVHTARWVEDHYRELVEQHLDEGTQVRFVGAAGGEAHP